MEKDVLSIIRKSHFSTIVYGVLGVLIIFFGGNTIVCVVALVFRRLASISMLYFFSTIFGAVLIAFFCFRFFHIQQAKEPRHVAPYVVQLPLCERFLLEDTIIRQLSLQPLPGGDHFSYVKGKRNLLFLLYHMGAYDKKQYKKTREKSTKAARRIVGLENEMPISEAKNVIRVNILLLDQVTEDDLSHFSVNAVYGMSYAEAFLNAYIDLKSLSLYIPAYVSLWNGGSSKYYFCVRKLLEAICNNMQ